MVMVATRSKSMKGSDQNNGHKPLYIGIIVMTCLLYVVNILFGGMASQGIPNSLFYNNTGDLAHVYYVEICPADWAFSIWGVIYTWGILLLGYGVSTIFRKGDFGYLYISPGHMPPSVYIWYMISTVLTAAWLLIWDRQLTGWAFIDLAATTFALYGAIFCSLTALARTETALKGEGMKKEIWLTRVIVHNGMALNAGWVTVATCVNLAVAMTYAWEQDQVISSTVGLCVLVLGIGIWVPLDLLSLDKYTRYMITPHLLLIWASSAVVTNNWDPVSSNSVLSAFVLAAAMLATLIKVVVMLWRHFRN